MQHNYHTSHNKTDVLYMSLFSKSISFPLEVGYTRSMTRRPTGMGLPFSRAILSKVVSALSVRPAIMSKEVDSGSH